MTVQVLNFIEKMEISLSSHREGEDQTLSIELLSVLTIQIDSKTIDQTGMGKLKGGRKLKYSLPLSVPNSTCRDR